MKFLLFILTILAVSCARADQENCSEERVQACIDNLLTAVMGNSTDEEACRKLRSSVDCLKEALDDCLRDERDSKVVEGLEELGKLLRDYCNADEGDNDKDKEMEELKKCYDQIDNYMFECIYGGTQQVMTLAVGKDDVDENMVKCAMYVSVSVCFVDRVREKCSEKAATMAEEELTYIPGEIAQACKAVGALEISDLQLSGENKGK